MSKTAEVLEAGAEQLREWAEWAKTDCFETFEEWFLGIKLADDEKPRVIITPPPKPEARFDPIVHMRCAETSPLFVPPKWRVEDVLRSVHHAMINTGIQVWCAQDFASAEFTWRLRCFKCDERLVVAAPYDEAHFITHVRDTIGEWASRHGHTNCIRAMIVHNGVESINV